MTRSLGIAVGAGPIERVKSDIVVVSVFEDERPLSAAAGRADWRLCGKLSLLIAEGRLSGAAGEAVLVTPRGAIRAPLLVVLGLGRRRDFGAGSLEAVANSAASRSLALHASKVAFPLPSSEATGIPLRSRVGAIVRGVVTAVAEREADLHLQLIAKPNEVVPVTEVLLAMQQPSAVTGVVVRVLDSKGSGSAGSTLRPSKPGTRPGTRGGAPSSSPTHTQVIK